MADRARASDPALDAPVDLLLATKLFVPRPAATLVHRPRLLDALTRGLRGPLTLIAAPAGWGKTTLLGAWGADAAGPAIALAWLSLDGRDNDPARFWTYVVAALRVAHPTVGDAARALLRSPRVPSLELVLTTLINDLAPVSDDTALVLDDYHAIENPTIHDSLTFFVDHLPPGVHLVIATRADPPLPLARWRARGALVEIRADDLRFTPDEAGAFLGRALGLPLDAATLAALEARTEGWIAGLQLAALALRDRADLTSFVGAFSGSHRFVADYLAEEVLQRQSAPVQSFLLRTSVLERLCAPLCTELLAGDGTGLSSAEEARPDASGAQQLLEHLDRANLFLIPLDGQRRWYRYHHLFAELLRHRLRQTRPDELVPLHRRAAAWLEREGLTTEAIHHALAARDFAHAASLLEASADSLWTRGELATLGRWLEALPPEVAAARPGLLLAHAWVQFLTAPTYRYDAVEATLRAASLAIDPGRPSGELRGKLLAIRSSVAAMQQDHARTIDLAREALARLPPDNLDWRIIPLVNLGIAHQSSGDVAAASRAFDEAIEVARHAGITYAILAATARLASVRVAQGRLHAAAALLHNGLSLAAERGVDRLPIVGNFYVVLGQLAYEWDDRETAGRRLLEGIRRDPAGEQLWPLLEGHVTLARLRAAQGDVAGAREAFQQAEQLLAAVGDPRTASLLVAFRARLALAQGQVARASELLGRGAPPSGDGAAVGREAEQIARGRVLLAEGRPGDALAVLAPAGRAAEEIGRLGGAVEIRMLEALAWWRQGDTARALAALERSLALAEPEDYVRTFVDEGAPLRELLGLARDRGVRPAYAERLLAAFEERPSPRSPLPAQGAPPRGKGDDVERCPPPAPFVEPLSEREREVLRLLVAGRSGPEIARDLIVAPSTIKTHLKRIYGKLDAHSRDQAIARARELKLT